MKTAAPARISLSPVRRFVHTWRWYLVFFFGVWIPVRSVLADYNPVPSGSMNPTILEGDVVYVNKLAYDLRVPLTLMRVASWREPARGDIVVVFSPDDGTRLVKRIVAVPGDTIAMSNDRLTVNGQALVYSRPEDDYGATIAKRWRPFASFAEENLTGAQHAVMSIPRLASPYRSFDPISVPAGKYFLMGDNRDNSRDSRSFGFADREAIVGRVEGVIVSWDINDTWLPRTERFFTSLH